MVEPADAREPEDNADQTQPANTPADGERRAPISAWEWVIACVGLVLVVGTIGFQVYGALTRGSSPPAIVVEVDTIAAIEGGYLITFRAANRGDQSAAGVIIEGVLTTASDRETSTVTLDYVPSRSERRGGLYFTRDPRQGEVQLRATGYQQP